MTRHQVFRDALMLPWYTGKRAVSHRLIRWWRRCQSTSASSLSQQVLSTQKIQFRRQRRDDIWIPVLSLKHQDEPLDATQLLARAGYLRQAYSGIYHLLPLGLRVQNKLEALIDKHMNSIAASKVSLSSISSQGLWERSGRLNAGSEFFKFKDRKDAKWLLAPTHEEEITSLVKDSVHSSGQLPIRLYQISRKYRDEKRPRGGLLRGKEFVMKDLYTFDLTQEQAHLTYDQVRQAYRNFLDELTIPYVEARADSGNMGGSLSHEYHFPSAAGEDDVISCDSCGYARNEEWVPECAHDAKDVSVLNGSASGGDMSDLTDLVSKVFVDKSRKLLVRAFAPRKIVNGAAVGINTYAVKAAVDPIMELDTGVEQAQRVFEATLAKSASPSGTVFYLFDSSIGTDLAKAQVQNDSDWLLLNNLSSKVMLPTVGSTSKFSLLKQVSNDPCPQCDSGTLRVQKAIEIGHTFHLGTRYSSKLGLHVKTSGKTGKPVAVEMGCHGIGISRLLAAVAAALSDSTGLIWPGIIAPFQAIIVADQNDSDGTSPAEAFYDLLRGQQCGELDVLLDDRANISMGYKLKDADLIGYPVIVVFGRTFKESGKVEIQCRRKQIKQECELEDAAVYVKRIIQQL